MLRTLSVPTAFLLALLTLGLNHSLEGVLGAVGAEQLPWPHPLGARITAVVTATDVPRCRPLFWGQDGPGWEPRPGDLLPAAAASGSWS